LPGLKDTKSKKFGGLAIISTQCGFRPMALRPRLSPGLPLSVRVMQCVKELPDIKTGQKFQARRKYYIDLTFGNLAIIAIEDGFRPIVLRPRLSPGLPFRVLVIS
jgi:hypothetical protein